MAGIKINSEVIDIYNQLRFGKGCMQYFSCKLSSDLSEVVIDHTGQPNASWEDMEATLPTNECRYVFFNFEFEQEGGKRYPSPQNNKNNNNK